MDTLGYVKKYQEEIKDSKKYSSIFNIWAFLFSSLYFFYKRMYLHFFIFLLTLVLLAYMFIPWLGADNAFPISLLVTHLIAGFIANPHYKKYMQNYIKNYKDAEIYKIVQYDSMSITKFILCMVFSVGLYSLYWGYKHWKKYQITTKDDVSPLGRALFIHLTAPSLFSKIGKSINSNIKLVYFGIGFLICSFGIAIIDKMSENINAPIFVLFLISIILFVLAILCLVIVQKKINEYNILQTNEKIKMTINIREIIVIIIGFIAFIVVPFAGIYAGYKEVTSANNDKTKHLAFEEYTPEQQEKIGASVGFIYRHIKGYKEVCQKEGYIMTKYPNDFSQYFSKEINELKNNLSKYNYTLENAENMLLGYAGFRTKVITSIYKELDDIRKLTIMTVIAEKQGISVDDVEWNNDWDNLFTLADTCKVFDENGIDILQEDESKYFLKANSF